MTKMYVAKAMIADIEAVEMNGGSKGSLACQAKCNTLFFLNELIRGQKAKAFAWTIVNQIYNKIDFILRNTFKICTSREEESK